MLTLGLEAGGWWLATDPPRYFEHSDQGRAALDADLRQLQPPACRLLVSGQRIEYRREPIPSLNASDRRALMKQRLKNTWPENSLKRGQLSGDTEPPSLLLAAMEASPLLQQGLSLLAGLQIPLAGLFDLGELLVARLHATGVMPDAALLVYCRGDRLHQYWAIHGQVCFARQSPCEDLARACAAELPRLRTHLQTEWPMAMGQEVMALILLAPDDDPLALELDPLPGLKLCPLPWRQHFPDAADLDLMVAGLKALPQFKTLPCYASPSLLRNFWRSRYLGWLTTAGFLAAAGLLAYSGWQYRELQGVQVRLAEEARAQQQILQDLERAQGGQGALPLSVSDLQAIQQQYQQLEAAQHALGRQWQWLKGLLGGVPTLTLEALTWQQNQGLSLKASVSGSTPRDAFQRYQRLLAGLGRLGPVRILNEPLSMSGENSWSLGSSHPRSTLRFEVLLEGISSP